MVTETLCLCRVSVRSHSSEAQQVYVSNRHLMGLSEDKQAALVAHAVVVQFRQVSSFVCQ